MEATSEQLQLAAQLSIVVDLAIENELDVAAIGRHWLVTTGRIDHGQSAHAQQHARVVMEAGVVGATMADRIVHGLSDARVGRRPLRLRLAARRTASRRRQRAGSRHGQ